MRWRPAKTKSVQAGGWATPAGIQRPLLDVVVAAARAMYAHAVVGHQVVVAGDRRRHSLAPATISYHLSVMFRAGLLVRSRDGQYVRYRRSPHIQLSVDH